MKLLPGYFFARVLNKLKLLPALNVLFAARVNGKKVVIPVYRKMGFSNLRISERWMIRLLDKLLSSNKEGAFIDVGMNIGQTLIKLRTVNRDLKYAGFEPNPHCVSYCRHLVQANRYENVEIIPAGLAEKNGILTLHSFASDSSAEFDSAATLVEGFRPSQAVTFRQYVPVFPFHEMPGFLRDEKIVFLKIDVEGAELEVIRGMYAAIEKHRPPVLCEILPAHSDTNMFRIRRQEEIEAIFKKIDYVFCRFEKDHTRLKKIDRIGIHSDVNLSDYLIIPRERFAETAAILGIEKFTES
jgi:FkbM family methyltransferase